MKCRNSGSVCVGKVGFETSWDDCKRDRERNYFRLFSEKPGVVAAIYILAVDRMVGTALSKGGHVFFLRGDEIFKVLFIASRGGGDFIRA